MRANIFIIDEES